MIQEIIEKKSVSYSSSVSVRFILTLELTLEDKTTGLKNYLSIDKVDDINLMILEWFLPLPIGVFGALIFTADSGIIAYIVFAGILSAFSIVLISDSK